MRALAFVLSAGVLVAACSEHAPSGGGRDAGTRDVGGGAIDAASTPDTSLPIDAAPLDAFRAADANDVDAAALACDGAMITLPYPSAPDGDSTDPPSCTSCPSFGSLNVSTAATTATLTGTVTGGATCTWTLVSPGCGGTTGPLGADPEIGSFSRTVPLFCGENRLQIVCQQAGGTVIATRTLTGPTCGGRDVQVTLSWGATSNDQELHLIRAGGHINDTVEDCTWFTCVHASPDWGTVGDPSDDPHKDVDWLGTFGPENVFLDRAPNGSYEVMVEYWGSGTTDAPSVTINLGGRTVWMGSHTMNLYDVWDVGTITFTGGSGTFTPVDTITPCASAWRTGGSMGCALPIP